MSGHRPDGPASYGPRESESWCYSTTRSSLRLELCRVGRAVVALGLLVPSGPVSAPAIRRTRLCCGPVRLGLVPCRDCGARTRHAVVHHPGREGPVLPDHYLSQRLPMSGPQLPTASRRDFGTV